MRTTIELSDRNYRRLRATAVERGLRGFSPIIEDAVERLLDQEDTGQELSDAMAQAEGAWSEADVAEWEKSRKEAWATWPNDRSSIPTS